MNIAGRRLQCCRAAATVHSGLGEAACRGGLEQTHARPPNHAHRAEVSLVAPADRASGRKGNRTE